MVGIGIDILSINCDRSLTLEFKHVNPLIEKANISSDKLVKELEDIQKRW